MADDKHKKKTLSYRRAVYFGTEPGMKTLEEYLSIAHSKFPTIKQRTIKIPGYPVIECRNYKPSDGFGIFMHLASYNPGERASILRDVGDDSASDVETTAPPKDTEFMDGDMMVLVADNHVLLCATNVHEKTAERYMRFFVKKTATDKACGEFTLEKVGDINKLKLIESHGVRSVTLNASIFDAELTRLKRKTISSKLNGSIMDELKALVLKDWGADEAERAENLTARIVLSYDSRKKKATIGRETLESMATKIIDEEDDDGFMVETLTGEKIRHSEIAIRKTVLLPKYGKSVLRDDAWSALKQYHSELKSSGTFEQ